MTVCACVSGVSLFCIYVEPVDKSNNMPLTLTAVVDSPRSYATAVRHTARPKRNLLQIRKVTTTTPTQ